MIFHSISSYRLRVESMLLKEEFLSMVDYMKPSISTLITAARGTFFIWVSYSFLIVANFRLEKRAIVARGPLSRSSGRQLLECGK